LRNETGLAPVMGETARLDRSRLKQIVPCVAAAAVCVDYYGG